MKRNIIQRGNNNILIEGDFYGSITIEKEEILPKELTMIPFVDATEIFGREGLLLNLKNAVDNAKKPVLLYGIGGIGKSALAKLFVEKYQSEYNHIIWISVFGSLKASIYNCFELKKNLKVEEINTDACVDQILNLVRQIKGKALLVLDNVSIDILDFLDRLPKSPDWKILATSRGEITDLSCVKVSEMSLEKAVELFQYYCPRNFETVDIHEVVQLIDCHPLSVVLYAKAIFSNPGIVELKSIIDIIRKSRLSDAKLKAQIRLPYDKNEAILVNHLASIFDFTTLNQEEIDTLCVFAYFPTSSIELERVFYFFSITPGWEERRVPFINMLEGLKTRGWLESEQNGYYRIHRLIQVLFIIHFNPENQKIMLFLQQLYRGIKNSGFVSTSDQLSYLPFVESALNNHPDTVKHDIFAAIATDSDRLFEYVGRIEDSIHNLEYAIEMWHKFPNQDTNLELAKTYHNLGVTYFVYKTDLEKAFEYQKKALEIREKYVQVTNQPHHSLAESYRQISAYFQHLHEYSEAAKFIMMAIEIDKQTLPPKNPKHADNLFSLAQLQSSIGDWESCLAYCIKSIEHRKEIPIVNYEEICDIMLLSSKAYANLGQKAEAKEILGICLGKYEEMVPKNSLKWEEIASRAAEIYRSIEALEDAAKYYAMALEYAKKYFGPNSQQYADLLNNIGLFHVQNDNPNEGLQFLVAAANIRFEIFGVDDFNVGISSMNIAEAYFYLGEFKTAFEYGLHAHKVFTNHENAHFHLALLHRVLAYIQCGLKQPMQARFHIFDCIEFSTMANPKQNTIWSKDFLASKESILKLCEELESQGYE